MMRPKCRVRFVQTSSLSAFVLISLFLSFSPRIDAQDKRATQKADLFDLNSADKKDLNLPQVTAMALESPINPEQYFVGPDRKSVV